MSRKETYIVRRNKECSANCERERSSASDASLPQNSRWKGSVFFLPELDSDKDSEQYKRCYEESDNMSIVPGVSDSSPLKSK